MKLIVGLGNPGVEYKDTRHNIGYMVVEKLAREFGKEAPKWEFDKNRNAQVCKVGEVLLVKPTTFMNASGEAVGKLMSYYKIEPSDIWVIHDDLDLPLGKLKIRQAGGAAGHKGVESIMAHLKTDAVVRFRLGIGRGKEDKAVGETDHRERHNKVIRFVLSRFTQHEAGELRKLVKHGTDAVRMSLIDGLDKAMNRFN
jgi:peptidyl-tRNA hydrolase, PTH1 family